MIALSFFRSTLIALLVSATASVLYLSLSLLFDHLVAIQVSSSFATLAYLFYLLSQAEVHFGRVSSVGAFLVCSLLVWFVSPPLLVLSIFNVGFIWLVRTIYFHNNAFLAVADLAFSVIAFTAALAAATQSQSVFLAFWSFFLAQAMIMPVLNFAAKKFTFGRDTSYPHETENHHQQSFHRAYRNAENALRKLAANS